MKRMIQSILTELNIQPVLVDIGASFGSPKVWDPIASNSVYVGFDPDLREMHDIPHGKFARSVIVNKAVTSNPDQSAVQFHLTRSPYCSSTLLPDTKSLSNYYFSDMFAVDHTKDVQSISLNAVLKSLSLEHVDWFKTDSQGTDLRLFRSLDNANRSRVLAVDVEPGLVDAYVGEDLFVDTHKSLMSEGFWISRMNVLGSIRVRHESLVEQSRSKPELAQGTFGRQLGLARAGVRRGTCEQRSGCCSMRHAGVNSFCCGSLP